MNCSWKFTKRRVFREYTNLYQNFCKPIKSLQILYSQKYENRANSTFSSTSISRTYCWNRGASVVYRRAGNSLNGILSKSLVFCEKMSEWAICWKNKQLAHSFIFGEQPERLAHGRSFLVSDLSDSLTTQSLPKKREWANRSFFLTNRAYIKHSKKWDLYFFSQNVLSK